jgi:hypothetical protein
MIVQLDSKNHRMKNKSFLKKMLLASFIVLLGLVLGFFSTSEYVKARGFEYIEYGNQIQRHQAIIEGNAGNPWQYRILAPFLIEILLKFTYSLNFPHSILVTFIFVRFIQDTTILIIAFAYYRKLGLPFPHALIGMALLAWGISYSHHNSDLQFNTFFDIIFYLIAGLCILHEKFIWIIPITFLAVLNRETSGFIPFLALSVSLIALPKGYLKKVLLIVLIACLVYLSVFICLRLMYGNQVMLLPYGYVPGFEVLKINLLSVMGWQRIIATLNILPILAIIGYSKSPVLLRIFFWVMLPLWLLIHFTSSEIGETRLLLVPQTMVIIPIALFALTNQNDTNDLLIDRFGDWINHVAGGIKGGNDEF